MNYSSIDEPETIRFEDIKGKKVQCHKNGYIFYIEKDDWEGNKKYFTAHMELKHSKKHSNKHSIIYLYRHDKRYHIAWLSNSELADNRLVADYIQQQIYNGIIILDP